MIEIPSLWRKVEREELGDWGQCSLTSKIQFQKKKKITNHLYIWGIKILSLILCNFQNDAWSILEFNLNQVNGTHIFFMYNAQNVIIYHSLSGWKDEYML